MKDNNTKNAVTFTVFSLLLLIITTFLVIYRNDLYYATETTFIRIGFIVEDAHNDSVRNKDLRPEIHSSKQHKNNEFYVELKPHKDSSSQEKVVTTPSTPSRENQFYDKFLAMLSTHSVHPVENEVDKTSVKDVPKGKPVIENPIAITILNMAKPNKEPGVIERKSVTPITEKTDYISQHSNPDLITIDKDIISSHVNKKLANTGKHVVSYPAEHHPTTKSTPKSWPSLFLPDSGFMNSAEISPFSLLSRFADLWNFEENDDDFAEFLQNRQLEESINNGYYDSDFDSYFG